MARKGKIKKVIKKIFDRFLGFENGVDITNETAVLHRRNEVIKNITAVSNGFFSIILFIFAFKSGSQANWLYPLLFVPFSMFLNKIIKTVIYSDRHDQVKQEIGMYLLTGYAFLSVVLFYARFYHEPSFEVATYVLIYYVIVVVSLYQSKKLILMSTIGMLTVMTVIHFTWTYNFSGEYQGLNIIEFLKQVVKDERFYDLLLRTTFFIIFSVVVFAIVSIGHYMQEDRKNELLKRREIQEDFTNIVSDLYKVVLSAKSPFLDLQHINLLTKMSLYLAETYRCTAEEIALIKEYTNIHLKVDEIADLVNPQEQINYNELKEKTHLGTQIAKRLQLAQKAEDIARAHIDGAVNDEFLFEMQQIQPEITSQIILICDLYITMRSAKAYKRAYPDNVVIEVFVNQFNSYFEYQLLDSFLRLKEDFKLLYDEA